MRRLGPLYGGALALVHSTPLRWQSDEASRPASYWMVAVGVVVGLAGYAVAAVLHAIGLPAPLAALFGLAVLTFATAALVERGVVSWVDRNTTHSPSVLAIVVLVFGTLVRAAAIVLVAPEQWLGVFVVTALVGRSAAAFLQAVADPIVDDETPRSLVVARAPAWMTAALSAAVVVVAALALGKAGVIAMAIAAGLAFALGLAAQRRDGTLSAPVVATAAALGELVVLLTATA
jgi:hypothetical protein